jgi:hypothetical protein
MVAKTVVDAKGDLIAGTAADTVNRLAVGNNGETLVADSSQATGLRYTAGNPIPNPVLNSSYQIWQRGTTIAIPSSVNTYTADRWAVFRGATGETVTRQVTNDTTNLPNIQYCARVQRDSGNTSTVIPYIAQSFETVNSIPYAGKTVTLSFYARAGANYSSTSNLMQGTLITGTGTDQNWLGYTGSVFAINVANTLTTTWQRFTLTSGSPLGTNISELSILFSPTSVTGTAGANDYFEVTGVQLDIGSVALPFRTNGATIQGELAACQRYYWRANTTGAGTFAVYGLGIANGAGTLSVNVQVPVPMRIAPTSVDYSNLQYSDTVTGFVPTSISIQSVKSSNQIIAVDGAGLSGLTQFRVYELRNNNNSAGYVGFSAEL